MTVWLVSRGKFKHGGEFVRSVEVMKPFHTVCFLAGAQEESLRQQDRVRAGGG